MTHISRKIFLGFLTSLAVMANGVVSAQSGITGSVGTFYVTPTSDFQDYSASFDTNTSTSTVNNIDPEYQWGVDASLGYIFKETANSVELFFRNISTNDSGSASGYFPSVNGNGNFSGDLDYELNSFDLMFSQFISASEAMQLRLSGGLAYVDLERSENGAFVATDGSVVPYSYNLQSTFNGWGPRISIDTRYGFAGTMKALGVVGNGSMAYYQGDMDSSIYESQDGLELENDPGNHAVLNFRANLGVDYVYFFKNHKGARLGLELGYLIDFYDDGALETNLHDAGSLPEGKAGSTTETTSISFAGPYLTLKGVF